MAAIHGKAIRQAKSLSHRPKRPGCFRAPGPRRNVMGVRFVGLWRVTAAK